MGNYIDRKEAEFELQALDGSQGADDVGTLLPGKKLNIPPSLVTVALTQRFYSAFRPGWAGWSEPMISESIALNHTLNGKPIEQITKALSAKHAGWEKSVNKVMKMGNTL